MDFDNRKVYSDTSITDGLVFFDVHALRHHILPNSDEIMNFKDPKESDDPQLFDDPSSCYSMIPRYSMIPSYLMIPSYSMIN